MSKLHEKVRQRAESPEDYHAQVLERYMARKTSLLKLSANKDFKEYLKLEEEMNNPKAVIAYKCTDAVCESLKQTIRKFWQRQRALEALQTSNGKAPRP